MWLEDRLAVVTSVEMPDWEVRRHRITMIRFEDKTWRVAAKTTAGGKVRYELTRWTPADEQVIGREIDYNAEYVAARDQAATTGRRRSHVTALLRILSPLVGFLPGSTKARLEAVYGVDPVASTFHSVFLEFLFSLCAFTLASIGQMILVRAGTSAGFPVTLLTLGGLVSAIDGAMRYSRILNEERPPPGFYEWLVRRRGQRLK